MIRAKRQAARAAAIGCLPVSAMRMMMTLRCDASFPLTLVEAGTIRISVTDKISVEELRRDAAGARFRATVQAAAAQAIGKSFIETGAAAGLHAAQVFARYGASRRALHQRRTGWRIDDGGSGARLHAEGKLYMLGLGGRSKAQGHGRGQGGDQADADETTRMIQNVHG